MFAADLLHLAIYAVLFVLVVWAGVSILRK